MLALLQFEKCVVKLNGKFGDGSHIKFDFSVSERSRNQSKRNKKKSKEICCLDRVADLKTMEAGRKLNSFKPRQNKGRFNGSVPGTILSDDSLSSCVSQISRLFTGDGARVTKWRAVKFLVGIAGADPLFCADF